MSTPFITPSSEIPKPLGTGTGPGTANKDEPDRGAGGLTALDEHYVYSLKDFQAFNSSTYQGIMAEVDLWVRPVIGDKALHSAFLGYLQPPKLLEKLTKLSNFVRITIDHSLYNLYMYHSIGRTDFLTNGLSLSLSLTAAELW